MKSDEMVLVKRYVKSFFGYLSKVKTKTPMEKISKELSGFSDFVNASERGKKLFHSLVASDKQRMQLSDNVSTALKISDETVKFLRLLAHNNRMFLIDLIAKEFERGLLKLSGIKSVDLVSSVDLKKADLDKISVAIEAVFDCKVSLKHSVNPDILGGLIIQQDSLMLDGSVSNKLENLRIMCKNEVAPL